LGKYVEKYDLSLKEAEAEEKRRGKKSIRFEEEEARGKE
jgi:hypothetical protein